MAATIKPTHYLVVAERKTACGYEHSYKLNVTGDTRETTCKRCLGRKDFAEKVDAQLAAAHERNAQAQDARELVGELKAEGATLHLDVDTAPACGTYSVSGETICVSDPSAVTCSECEASAAMRAAQFTRGVVSWNCSRGERHAVCAQMGGCACRCHAGEPKREQEEQADSFTTDLVETMARQRARALAEGKLTLPMHYSDGNGIVCSIRTRCGNVVAQEAETTCKRCLAVLARRRHAAAIKRQQAQEEQQMAEQQMCAHCGEPSNVHHYLCSAEDRNRAAATREYVEQRETPTAPVVHLLQRVDSAGNHWTQCGEHVGRKTADGSQLTLRASLVTCAACNAALDAQRHPTHRYEYGSDETLCGLPIYDGTTEELSHFVSMLTEFVDCERCINIWRAQAQRAWAAAEWQAEGERRERIAMLSVIHHANDGARNITACGLPIYVGVNELTTSLYARDVTCSACQRVYSESQRRAAQMHYFQTGPQNTLCGLTVVGRGFAQTPTTVRLQDVTCVQCREIAQNLGILTIYTHTLIDGKIACGEPEGSRDFRWSMRTEQVDCEPCKRAVATWNHRAETQTNTFSENLSAAHTFMAAVMSRATDLAQDKSEPEHKRNAHTQIVIAANNILRDIEALQDEIYEPRG